MRALKLFLILGLLLMLSAKPALALDANSLVSLPFNFLLDIKDNIQLTLTFDTAAKVKLETQIAQSKISSVQGLTINQSNGALLEQYTQHIEKAVSLSSKLDHSTQEQLAPFIASAVSASIPVVTGLNGTTPDAAQVIKVEQTNQWAANKLPSNTASTSGLKNTVSTTNKQATSSAKPNPTVSANIKSSNVPTAPAVPTPPPGRTIHLPVLMYHYIRTVDSGKDPLGFALSVTPGDFQNQMTYLQSQGFHTIHPSQLVTAIKSGAGLPSRPIILTFDDSYRDFYNTALPVLQQHGFVATNYVISDFVYSGWDQYMSVDMVRQIDRLGMNIGGHTKTHPNLTTLSLASMQDQIKGSKNVIESWIGHPISDFAYPYGSFNSTVAGVVAQSGFADGRTTLYGLNYTPANLYTMPTVRISGGDSLQTFIKKVNQ